MAGFKVFAAFAALLQIALAHPASRSSIITGSPSSQCSRDPLYQVFHDKSHSSIASSFCSGYLHASTSTQTTTVTLHPTSVYEETTTVTAATAYQTVTNSALVTRTITQVSSTTVIVPLTSTVFTQSDIFHATLFTTETDTTVFATETSVVSFTTTDATSTSFETDTVIATVTSPAKVKRHNRCKPDEPSWLSSARTSAASHLSSACSCLITPTAETVTVTETGAFVSQTSETTIDATAQGTQTVSITLTDLASTTEVETVSETSIVPATATTSVTLTVVLTVEATAYETTTVTSTQTIEKTALTAVTQTATRTTTLARPQATGQCADLPNPYTAPDGHQYELHCGTFFPIDASIAGFSGVTQFSDCLDRCGSYSNCAGADYAPSSQYCELFSAYESSVSGYVSGLRIS